eukprot:5637529-Pyramimonas_sp.AAC.1
MAAAAAACCRDGFSRGGGPEPAVRAALLANTATLSAPEPSDPQALEGAKQFKTNRAMADQTAKHCNHACVEEAVDVKQ